jgi:inosine/xanthosine triphosphate pyrophosphatase family protein
MGIEAIFGNILELFLKTYAYYFAELITNCDRPQYMKNVSTVIELCPDTGLLVGYVPGLPGAHSQAASLEELNTNMSEVIDMLNQHDAA